MNSIQSRARDRSRLAGWFLAASGLAAPALLGGCSATLPPHVVQISSDGRPQPMPTASPESHPTALGQRNVAILPPAPGQQDPRMADFSARLATALERRGIRISDDADTMLAITISRRDASIGIAGPGPTDGRPPEWISPRRGHNPLRKCRPWRTTVVLVANVRGDTSTAFAARGEFDACQDDPQLLDQLAEQLADLIMHSDRLTGQVTMDRTATGT